MKNGFFAALFLLLFCVVGCRTTNKLTVEYSVPSDFGTGKVTLVILN